MKNPDNFNLEVSNLEAKNEGCRVLLTKLGMVVSAMKTAPVSFPTIRISENEFVDTRTGVVRQFQKSDGRTASLYCFKRSYRNAENLLRANFSGGKNEIFLTLSYKEKMTDPVKLCNDFKEFRRRLKKINPDFDYIAMAEFNSHGIHLHVFLIGHDDIKFYVPRESLVKCWQNDNVYVRRISRFEDVENLIAYVNPFKTKKKLNFLHLYPIRFHVLRCSSGIKKPKILKMGLTDALEMAKRSGMLPYRSESFLITTNAKTDREYVLNRIEKIYFKQGEGVHV